MKYILHGAPTALARARFSRGCVFDSQSQEKKVDALHIKKQHGSKPLYRGPLSVELIFYMPMAAKLPEKTRDRLRGSYHTYRKDLDNLVKYILDVCNDILYKDDSSIAKICAKKIWSDAGKTELIITELENHEATEENSPS